MFFETTKGNVFFFVFFKVKTEFAQLLKKKKHLNMTDSMKYVLDASLRHVMRHDHQETRHMLHMKEWNMRCCVTAKFFFF